jgi:hypothetical protein
LASEVRRDGPVSRNPQVHPIEPNVLAELAEKALQEAKIERNPYLTLER